MRPRALAAVHLGWGIYLILSSVYCFLAFLPFTYLFVIKSPPYTWVSLFARDNLLLLWGCTIAWAAVSWTRGSWQTIRARAAVRFGLAVVIWLANPVANARENTVAMVWSALFLLCAIAFSMHELLWYVSPRERSCADVSLLDGILIGCLTGLISCATLHIHAALQGTYVLMGQRDVELMFWVVFEHVTLALLVVAAINLLLRALSKFSSRTGLLSPTIVGCVVFAGLAMGCAYFLESSFSVPPSMAWSYSILLAAALTTYGLRLFLAVISDKLFSQPRWLLCAAVILTIAAVAYVPEVIGPDDWNGILHISFTLLLWAFLAVSISRLHPRQRPYSLTKLGVVLGLVLGSYAALRRSSTAWASEIGHDRSQISRQMLLYASQNTSFRLVDTILGNEPASGACDEHCKTLRQYSNLQNAHFATELKLVDKLEPTTGPKPNIFILVIDSLRPDYVGAYNPRADFTPNLDALARESVVFRNVYTDYAGTALSEPAIWSGALLPHAHYPKPFDRANSLEKLARCDGYQMVVSYNEVLSQIIPPSRDLVLLDADKKEWMQIEISSTLQQLETYLDRRASNGPPVLFYAQPMNLHVHGRNDLPKRTSDNWKDRDGFDNRIAYAVAQTDRAVGQFVRYLKSKELFDNSIIVITADHGDATGELGRMGHSTIIYPEVMRVPLIVHLPPSMAKRYIYDHDRLSALIDITPSLYYLLGHGPVRPSPLIGRPIFVKAKVEFDQYPRPDLFLASDTRAVYGILSGDGRWFYATYDTPSRSMLFDLQHDPNGLQDVTTADAKRNYDQRILDYLQIIAESYGNLPNGSSNQPPLLN